MLKNKKAFLARHWIIAFTVFTAIIGLSYLMIQGFATEYNKENIIDSNFNKTYNKYSNLQSSVSSMLEESRGKEGLSFVGTFTTLFGVTITIIQLVFASLSLPGAMLKQFALDVGAPSEVATIIFTLPLIIITAMIVFIIISSISRGKL